MEPWETEGGPLLIVHGDQARRVALAQRLQEAGYAIVTAPNGQEGANLLSTKAPELVILDVYSPEVGGLQFLESIKANRASRAIPVILLAPPEGTDAVERGMEAGADDFILAPYSPSVVKTQVHEYLRIGRWRRQEQQMEERETLLKIERDVQIARQIQAGFLPSDLPQPEGWEIAASFYPAREVAGDFYDAFPLSQGRRVGFVIADICDKGVGAALFMALFRSLIRAYSQQHYSMRWMDVLDESFVPSRGGRRASPSTGSTALKNAMELTNDYMIRNHAGANMFATTFFGVLDPATGQLMYVNGGHNPPAVLSVVDGQTVVRERLKPTGPAVGMLPDIEYRIGQTDLEPGDKLFCFTDGVPDAKNVVGERFGENRMLPLVEQPSSSARELLDRVDAALKDHIGEADQFDDITMIALHYKSRSQ